VGLQLAGIRLTIPMARFVVARLLETRDIADLLQLHKAGMQVPSASFGILLHDGFVLLKFGNGDGTTEVAGFAAT
jgi:hypothetical protein